MKMMLKWLSLLVGVPTAAIALFFFWGSAGSYDRQNYAAIFDYGVPRDGTLDSRKESYTLVSYNIGYLSGLENNTTTQPNRAFFEANQAKAIAALQSVDPDIVAFQEIDFGSKRSYQVNQLDAIARALKLSAGAIAINWDKNYLPFPYWPPTAHFGKILSGQAILSRYPIDKNSRIVLEKVADKPFFYNAFYLDRLAQVAQIDLGGQSLVVINIHLEAFNETTRTHQTQFVKNLAEEYAQTNPVIVMGDFNSAINRAEETAFSIEVMAKSEVFTSAVPRSQWGSATATFPANQPEYKLDYVWYTPSTIETVKAEVLNAAGEASDHLPLMVRFKLK